MTDKNAVDVREEITRQLIADGVLEDTIAFLLGRVKDQYQGERDEMFAVSLLASKSAGIALARAQMAGVKEVDVGFYSGVLTGLTVIVPALGKTIRSHFCTETAIIACDRFGLDLDLGLDGLNGHL